MSFSGNPVPARERGTPAGTLSRIVHGNTYSIQSMVTTKFLKRKKRKEGAMQELQRTTRESNHATERTAILAAVVPEKAHPFVLEELDLDEPREDEVLVRVVATGICHTDLIIRDQYYPVPLPVVLGHEGAGVVERVGAAVTKVKAGDHVVMTYPSCGKCPNCMADRKSTRLNSSHSQISYAVFCLKKKKTWHTRSSCRSVRC